MHIFKIKILSFDIQVEIIKRLPVKSLIQFRSVCKAWKSLIDSSHFIAGYNAGLNQAQHLMIKYEVIDDDKEEIEVKYVSFVDDDTFPQQKFSLIVPLVLQDKVIIGSSHGLFCLTSEDYDETQMALLWNPTVRKSIVVPNDDTNHNVIDDQWFSYVVGFGVCPHTMDPKLVKITYINNTVKMESISSIPCQVMVFTLSSGEWTCLCSSNLPRKSIQFTYIHTVVGQFIYWLAFDWIAVDGKYRNLIMSFDMSTQEFKEINLPDYLAMRKEEVMFVSRVRESLAVVEYCAVDNGPGLLKGVCNVWIMDHGDFTKLFTINPPKAAVACTLGFRKSGEPIVELQLTYRDFAIVVYEPGSEHITDLGINGKECSLFGCSYMESLLLLDYEDGHIVKCGAVKR